MAWLTALKSVSDAPGDSHPIPPGAKWDHFTFRRCNVSHCLEPIYFVFI